MKEKENVRHICVRWNFFIKKALKNFVVLNIMLIFVV